MAEGLFNFLPSTYVRAHELNKRRRSQAVSQGRTSLQQEPIRRRNKMALVGVIFLVAAVLMTIAASIIHPAGKIKNSDIIIIRETSAIYVKINDIWYNAANAVSANLIIGRHEKPVPIPAKELATVRRGGFVGIIGAPGVITTTTPNNLAWTICDRVHEPDYTGKRAITTTAIADTAHYDQIMGADVGVLGKYKNQNYLLYRGKKYALNTHDRAIMDAFGLDQNEFNIRPISTEIFNAIPQQGEISRPLLHNAGKPWMLLPGHHSVIGAVGYVHSEDQYYAFEKDGLQPIPSTVATLLRNINSYKLEEPMKLDPDDITKTPVASEITTSMYPQQKIRILNSHRDRIVCQSWQHHTGGGILTMLAGDHLPGWVNPIPVVGHNTAGWGTANQVYVPSGMGIYFAATNDGRNFPTHEAESYLSDAGVRFPLDNTDPQLNQSLGLYTPGLNSQPLVPVFAPWSIAQLFPQGPLLSKPAALVLHPADPGLDTHGNVINHH